MRNTTSPGTLGSLLEVDDLIRWAKETKQPILSLVNKTMHDHLHFIQKCAKSGITPVVGLELLVSWDDSVATKFAVQGELGWPLVVLATNHVGYKNLIALSTYGCTTGKVDIQSVVDWPTIRKYKDGLVAFYSPIPPQLQVAITRQPNIAHPDKKVSDGTLQVLGPLPQRVVYLNPKEDHETYLYLNRIILNDDTWSELEKPSPQPFDWSALATVNWASVDYGIGKNTNFTPSFHKTDEDFVSLCYAELDKRGLMDERHIARLEYELSTILKFGYVDYFFIVSDLIAYARSNCGGYFSAGRGSVGSSLVAYLLGITRVDPIAIAGFGVELPFDRFLNSGRKTMPDIDMDFLPQDRAAVIAYLGAKYGHESVSHISTVLTLGAKAAIRDLARVSGKLTPEVEAAIKLFPDDQHLTLDMVMDSHVYDAIKDVKDFDWLLGVARKLEGKTKGYGVHASGIAVSAVPMVDVVPMYLLNDRQLTQYGQDSLESIGIVKFDVLGLRTLQSIKDALVKIKESEGYEINLDTIPIDDPSIYEFINNTDMVGLFQWDTYNYRRVVADVKPHNFQQLVDLNTLGRSAALLSGLTDKYIARKNGAPSEPLHNRLAGMMLDTHELPLYQEQMMSLFVKLANYSMSEADDVRKAIGKKIPEVMEQQKGKFAAGCIANGLTQDEVDEIWAIIDKFSKYTWNYGHAVAYTKICYETAYLACHHPAAWYCALIDNAESSQEVGRYQAEMLKRGVSVLPVDINKSELRHKVLSSKSVLSGFSGLRYISDETAQKLLDIRRNAKFESVEDFLSRVPAKIINKTALKSLYCAGAFRSLIGAEMNQNDYSVLTKRIGEPTLVDLQLNQYNRCGRVVVDPIDLIDGFYHKSLSELKTMQQVVLLRYVVDCRVIYTKKGNRRMAFVTFEGAGVRDELVYPPDKFINVETLTKGSLYEFTCEWGYKGPIIVRSKLLHPIPVTDSKENKETNNAD